LTWQDAEKGCGAWFDKLTMSAKPIDTARPHPEPVEG